MIVGKTISNQQKLCSIFALSITLMLLFNY